MNKLCLSGALLTMSLASANAASIKWTAGYDLAISTAKSSHRLLMVDFSTDWCGWCKKLDKDTYEADSIVAESAKFVPVKLNAEKDGVVQAKKYHVAAFPTILFLKPTGEVVWKVEGYMNPTDFAKQMNLALTVTAELPKLEHELAKTGANPNLDAQLITFYAGMGALDKIKTLIANMDEATINGEASNLAAAYSDAGDAYQSAQKMQEAIHCFRKTEKIGKSTQVAYARLSLAQCYLALSDTKNAKVSLEALMKMGPETKQYQTQGKEMLLQLSLQTESAAIA